ncbi:alpha-ketoacid dehydrogenase kinase N-terminal domain-containing protein [Punctularia strigosozonata HHB-11173 SS5]|uniref:alpha-ketoacid dehydrogenase kinase N-terminal domain-containing protein n=1 Tax=Punctularia strigosozonata (strain HHB-11173) TaxID=741275 RepID=UPI0004417DC9|nr:alpha-ketoacid dehydrogenase kinase N-terminal domain-containing protein [Punctularia strigosozonata HHB-11173 SS5]EIN10655.1 alpha-ketoacid dehydrogenase kinase N-terminal domain-containing protein [Punctularia strigosozonata HHB-11173 SS5]
MSSLLASACPLTSSRRRSASNQPSFFYQNKQLELYARRDAYPLTLRQLVYFGRSLNENKVLQSANYVRKELPVRIAHRLRDIQALPYVVVTQEGVGKVYELYWAAFEKIRRYPEVRSLSENDAFCTFLQDLLGEHRAVIPLLSLGLSLSSPYLPPEQLDSFMRRMLVSRLSRRVIVEHHIALSDTYAGRDARGADAHVGIIDTRLDVGRTIQKCSSWLRERHPDAEPDEVPGISTVAWPEVVVEGQLATTISYIREHLEYIVFEILKNSMRATRRFHATSKSVPPIYVTVVGNSDTVGVRISDQGGGLVTKAIKSPSDLFSFSHARNASRLEDERLVALRTASSHPHGIRATVDEQVKRWKNGSSLGDGDVPGRGSSRVLSRIGIGLPMSHIHATYFGGSLELVSLDGWGTDCYVRLPRLGTNVEGIEV